MENTSIEFNVLKEELLRHILTLEKEVYDLENICMYETQRARFHTGRYEKLFFIRMPIQYTKTAFYYFRNEITNQITATFDPYVLEQIYKQMKDDQLSESEHFMTLCCHELQKTDTGTMLLVGDPYYQTYTCPIRNLPCEEAELKDRLIRAKVTFLMDHDISNLKCEIIDIYPFKINSYYCKEKEQWLPLNSPDETELLNELRCMSNLEENLQEVYQFLCRMKAEGYATHLDKKYLYKYGHLDLRTQKNKYILMPRRNHIDCIIFQTGPLTPDEKWAYESFDMFDDFVNGIDIDLKNYIIRY